MPDISEQEIIEALRRGDWSVPYKVAQIGEPAVRPLVAAAQHPYEQVRFRAIKALGIIGSVHSVEPLIQAMHDGSWTVRSEAAYSLGHIGDSRAVESLIEALGDENGVVRYQACNSLVLIGEPAIKSLREVSHTSSDEQVRQLVTEALTRIHALARHSSN